MFYYVLFCQHLGRERNVFDLDSRTAKARNIKEAIGAYLREIREAKGETLQNIAERITDNKEKANRGVLSKLETGKANPTIDMFLDMLLSGYRIDFEQMCERFVAEDADRDREERVARRLLEQLLGQGAATRKRIIELLEDVKNPDV